MKRWFLFLWGVGFSFFIFAKTTLAQTGDLVIVPADQTIDHDYFAFGNTIRIEGTINGDLYTAGNLVEISGRVNGDVLAAGNTVSITGIVSQDVRTAGRQITITGDIGQNLTAAGQAINIETNASMSGSIVAGTETLTIAAPVGGNVRVKAAHIILTDTGRIAGDLTYPKESNLTLSPSATISGQIITESIPNMSRLNSQEVSRAIAGFGRTVSTFFTLVNTFTWLILGLLGLALIPKFFNDQAAVIDRQTGSALLWGFVILFLTPIILMGIMLTLLGMPLALIGFFLYGLLVYLATLPVGYWLGRSISQAAKWNTSPYLQYVLGLIVVIAVGLIPVIGWIFKFVVVVLGLGSIFLTLLDRYRSGINS